MKVLQLIVAMFVLSVSGEAVWARIGETEAQISARYGHIHRGHSHGNVRSGAWLHGAWICRWGEVGRRDQPDGNDFEERSIRYVSGRN